MARCCIWRLFPPSGQILWSLRPSQHNEEVPSEGLGSCLQVCLLEVVCEAPVGAS